VSPRPRGGGHALGDSFTAGRELPDYYIAPTLDFTRYTRDYEAKYWSKDTAFDWSLSVPDQLAAHLARLPAGERQRVVLFALPLVESGLIQALAQTALPRSRDGLRALAELLPGDSETVRAALDAQAPLEELALPLARLRDRLVILERRILELREAQRAGIYRDGGHMASVATPAERRGQAARLAASETEARQVRRTLRDTSAELAAERRRLVTEIGTTLDRLAPRVRAELAETQRLVAGTLRSGLLPADRAAHDCVCELVRNRQLHALKDIANHAVVVEQSAIAPLTMGIIHYKRRREIQEAMTTFVNDEAKHSAVFRRYMAEKLAATERIPQAIIKGGDRYLWLARVLPSGAIFLAVVVEAIGAGFLEFFGEERHMPEPLFRNICRTIAERDERRHVELCAATYNELYRRGTRWERLRNAVGLRMVLTAAYGDKSEDHYLIQACRAFGLPSSTMYRHVLGRLSRELARVGVYVPPEQFFRMLPRLAAATPAAPSAGPGLRRD
jgi:hypothetical protein